MGKNIVIAACADGATNATSSQSDKDVSDAKAKVT